MNLKAHEKILRDALGDGYTMSEQALGWVITANKLSDVYQLTPERHFDNAPNREAICDRWKSGLKRYLDCAIELTALMGKGERAPENRKKALKAFGVATHALADFYAHTNWIELSVAQQNLEAQAPLFGESCQVNDLPAQLESGYFNIWYGTCGCPKVAGKWKPPRGYSYCHEQIAKDYPNKGHGSDRIGVEDLTYYELATMLATKATSQLWKTLYDCIVAKCSSTDTMRDAEALFFQLAWGEGYKS